MRSPSGGEARHRGGTQVGKAPPSPEMTISGLTKGQLVGDDDVAKHFIIPRLCRTLRPAPQAGCFVSRLSASNDSAQIALRHRAFRTVALAPSSALANRPPTDGSPGLQRLWSTLPSPAGLVCRNQPCRRTVSSDALQLIRPENALLTQEQARMWSCGFIQGNSDRARRAVRQSSRTCGTSYFANRSLRASAINSRCGRPDCA